MWWCSTGVCNKNIKNWKWNGTFKTYLIQLDTLNCKNKICSDELTVSCFYTSYLINPSWRLTSYVTRLSSLIFHPNHLIRWNYFSSYMNFVVLHYVQTCHLKVSDFLSLWFTKRCWAPPAVPHCTRLPGFAVFWCHSYPLHDVTKILKWHHWRPNSLLTVVVPLQLVLTI